MAKKPDDNQDSSLINSHWFLDGALASLIKMALKQFIHGGLEPILNQSASYSKC